MTGYTSKAIDAFHENVQLLSAGQSKAEWNLSNGLWNLAQAFLALERDVDSLKKSVQSIENATRQLR